MMLGVGGNEAGAGWREALTPASFQALLSHLPPSPPSQGLGGVRLEDDVLITATGAEPLAAAPRSVAEVEAVLAGGAWPPREGAAA